MVLRKSSENLLGLKEHILAASDRLGGLASEDHTLFNAYRILGKELADSRSMVSSSSDQFIRLMAYNRI